MRLLLAALALAGATAAATPAVAQDRPPAADAPLDPETVALAQQVVDLAYPPERRREMYARVIDAMAAQSRAAAFAALGRSPDAGEGQIFDRYFERVRTEAERLTTQNSPAIFAAFARAYARSFTRDELMQIRAFVATPAGAKYIQRSADLLSDPDVAAANTAYMTSAFSALQPLEAELRQELLDYHQRQQAAPAGARPVGSRR